MRSKLARGPLLFAAVALMTIALPAPVAGAATAKTGAASVKQMAKQIKALREQTAALDGLASDLKAKIASLEANRPTSVPLLEGAGGDLVGSFPNPQLRSGTIVGTDIADGTIFGRHIAIGTLSGDHIIDGTVGPAEIADASIGLADMAFGSVGSRQLLESFVVRSDPNPVGGNNASGGNAVSCPLGTRLLSGGAEWSAPAQGMSFLVNSPVQGQADSWEVSGQNNSGSTRSIFAKALCLSAGP
jgi:hypothetical protein